MLVEIDDLIVQRDGRSVLQVDHLAMKKGEVLAVVGPNGAGKSTLLLILARLLRRQHGRIEFDKQDIESLDETAFRRRIALVLQEPLLFNTTVFQNTAIGLKFRGLSNAEIEPRVIQWLDRLGIAHLAQRPARKLSGGEAQRVSLARAFVLQPELLLMDEPFSPLDVRTRISILEELKDILAETNTSAVFVTHALEEAARVATQVAILLSGKLCQSGKSQEVFDHPASPEVATFLGERSGE